MLHELEPGAEVPAPEEPFAGAAADVVGADGAAVVRIVAVGAAGADEPPSSKTPPVDDGALEDDGFETDGEALEDPDDPEDPEEPELPEEDDPAAQLPTGGTSGFEPAA